MRKPVVFIFLVALTLATIAPFAGANNVVARFIFSSEATIVFIGLAGISLGWAMRNTTLVNTTVTAILLAVLLAADVGLVHYIHSTGMGKGGDMQGAQGAMAVAGFAWVMLVFPLMACAWAGLALAAVKTRFFQ